MQMTGFLSLWSEFHGQCNKFSNPVNISKYIFVANFKPKNNNMKKTILSAILLLFVAIAAQAQNITVHGTVVSATDDEPLIGASVIPDMAGATGVMTDFDGNFDITVPDGSNLTVTYIGFKSKTVKAEPQMKIVLEENSEILDEVVVVGYQTVRKADLTGAVAVMDMKEPLSENSGNIMSSMAGKMPGVSVVPSAEPGATGSIRIRGVSTANASAAPLYVVDGVPTDNINSINPADIETMQVLKDAASASIYGSRAANGVIIITTKKGKGDRLTVNINYALNMQTLAKTYDMLDANQWGEVYWQAFRNSYPGQTPYHVLYGSGETPKLQPFVAGNPNYPTANTDWQDEVYQTSWTNNLTATVSNNTEKGSVLFSANYINQNGNLKTTFYERYSARINSHYNINKYVSVGENLSIARWSNRGSSVYGDDGIAYAAMTSHPALPVRGLDGEWTRPALIGSDAFNPVQSIELAKDNDGSSWRILGNAYVEVRPIDGLLLKSNIGIEHSQYFIVNRNRALNPKPDSSEEYPNSVYSAYSQGDTWTWSNTANYNKTFGGKHHVTLLLGTEAIGYTQKFLNATKGSYMFEDTDYMQIGTGQIMRGMDGNKNQWSIFSLFGKADYNYADRYLASFTIRRDENSRFAKKHRAGTFPAFSAAWRPSQESFFPHNNILTDLKVRYSWGQNGQADIGQLYPAYSLYVNNTGNGAYDIAGSNGISSGITLASTGNPNLTWETTTQNNIGVDLQFLGGALNLTADYYIKNTKDMLTCPEPLSVAGENAKMWVNTGKMKNRGWEIQLGYYSPDYGDFSWSGNINFSQNKNELVFLNSREPFLGGDTRMIPGQPMGVYYGYVCDGIFQNITEVANHAQQEDAAPGRLIFRDLDGNGVINENDRCIIGDPNPDLAMGLNLAFRYKAFTLETFFSGEFGFDIINHMKVALNSMSYGKGSLNRSVALLNAWTPTNTNTDVPALSLTNSSEQRFSSYYVENGSYMKMKYLKFSYSLPKSIISKIRATDLNVYAQVENVFTITDYKGLDPEIAPSGYGARYDDGSWPRPRTFTLGVNLQF